MSKKNKIKYFLVIFILAVTVSASFIVYYALPDNLSIVKNSESTLDLYFPVSFYIQGEKDSNININGRELNNEYLKIDVGNTLKVSGNEVGETKINIKLFGIIPIRTIEVNVLPEVNVYPGGQAIGVMLKSRGVMVVNTSYVNTEQGPVYPAQKAGIEVGDSIIKINNQEINDKHLLYSKIQEYGRNQQKVKLLIKKDMTGKMQEVPIKPVKNIQGEYMIGLYVDDGVSGVGTLTFYNQETKEFGALGHIVTESESHRKIDVNEGKILEAKISGINFGQQGIPGEKHGSFFHTKGDLGEIEKNTRFGIYGSLKEIPVNPHFEQPIPVAAASQVQTGPAKIYTVLQGNEIEEFEIEIERVRRQSSPETKGMVINITDPELKRYTGGIIQGMSGSPIVQNNMLVGAVTHVFVNEPGRGYGVFAEWMLNETSEIINSSPIINHRQIVNF